MLYSAMSCYASHSMSNGLRLISLSKYSTVCHSIQGFVLVCHTLLQYFTVLRYALRFLDIVWLRDVMVVRFSGLACRLKKTEVVSSMPANVTVKRPLVRKAKGNHLTNSTSLETAQSPVSGFCYARNRVCKAVRLRLHTSNELYSLLCHARFLPRAIYLVFFLQTTMNAVPHTCAVLRASASTPQDHTDANVPLVSSTNSQRNTVSVSHTLSYIQLNNACNQSVLLSHNLIVSAEILPHLSCKIFPSRRQT